jgi:NAD(P)-dependent dehydrogenase (short-subunit alcohol dehydrogenase family)
LLTNLLLPFISEQERIVFVCYDAHNSPSFASSNFKFLDPEILVHPSQTQLKEMQRYYLSKLCNLYCTYEMVRRIKKNITVNAFNHGFIPETRLSRDGDIILKFLIKTIHQY